MPKNFTKAGQTVDMEANFAFAIAASDTVDVSTIGAKIHCNKTGNYNLLLSANSTPVVMYLVAGVTYPLRIQRLYVTNTDYVDGLIGITSNLAENDK